MPLVRFWSPEVLAESAGLARFLKPGKSRCPAHIKCGFPRTSPNRFGSSTQELKKWRSKRLETTLHRAVPDRHDFLMAVSSVTIWAIPTPVKLPVQQEDVLHHDAHRSKIFLCLTNYGNSARLVASPCLAIRTLPERQVAVITRLCTPPSSARQCSSPEERTRPPRRSGKRAVAVLGIVMVS
jgi:hypothetical protein